MALKRPDSISFSKKNDIRPFEDTSSLDFWSQKNDASLFVVGQSTKKRPDGMIFVRMFDYRVLDMCEVGIENYKAMSEFKVGTGIAFWDYLLNILHRPLNRLQDTSHCCTLRLSSSTRTRGSFSSSRCLCRFSMAKKSTRYVYLVSNM